MENEQQEESKPLEFSEFFKNEFETEYEWRGRNVDWFLQMLVDWVNNHGLEFPVTLHTPTGMVSGTLISHQKYFEQFGDNFGAAWRGDAPEKMRDLIAKFGAPQKNNTPHQYIHLADARCYGSDGNSIPNEGMLWRGKIVAVNAFNFGGFKRS